MKSIRSWFSGTDTPENSHWSALKTNESVDELIGNREKPQIIYKHSYRCAVSIFSKRSLETGLDDLAGIADLHLVDVVSLRPVSAYITEKTGIRHESPQVILLHNGAPFWSASHGNVKLKNLQDALDELL
ncbi:bacillithiol system redox-active protein YtxJ [Rhodohalobacter sp. SW132]|uniref:bacillithiol system redox-active protein YtxJ n=1 Tax=Rhodohalobacter sp. SW132 TaxID=2293433 RepID=UPI000E25BCD7|nr:bacillithiol system redox-active protein YtxJ [Rhodohalobacter sp. SW132]REL33033.1 bacillithiol system redox-active protein YtxJ [Rhodohalobacter sp. SW132]